MTIITEQQQKIISNSARDRLIVKSGPGTGKTWSLIERIKFLTSEEGLEPATEILVLSFSVAAVKEIRKRLMHAVETEGYDEDLLLINIRTFDSFASHFMYMIDNDVKLDALDYDQRIVKAIEIIRESPEAHTRLHRLRHIMVDEVQDLVGLRAKLTLAILETAAGGFTLFGDPAQAVYNFLMDEDVNGPTSDEFIIEVTNLPGEEPAEIFMSENFRVGENLKLKELAEKGRKHLINGNPEESYIFLRRTFADLPSVGSLHELALPDGMAFPQTAFLCRTNGQALLLAGTIRAQKIPFYIRKPLEENDTPSWVGAVFSRWERQKIRRKEFESAISELPEKLLKPELASDAWKELQSVTYARSGLRVTQLREALLDGGIFRDISSAASKDLMAISTVHRAKGREFDNVVLLIHEETDPDSFLDEARVMFVGLTRAKKGLYKLPEKGFRGIHKCKDRWVRTSFSNGQQRITAIEVGCRNDIDRHSPVALTMFEDDPEYIEENQLFLRNDVKSGEDLRLEFFRKEKGVPLYLIKVRTSEGWTAVAHTSVYFGRSLKSCMIEIHGSKPYKWPLLFDSLWVREVVTEIGNLGNEDVPRNYRTTGLWLGLRVDGFGKCLEWGQI